MEQNNKIIINEIEYEIIDTKEYITIADSYVVPQNKIGTGNGEAKLYVGSTTDGKTSDFFGDFDRDCFYKKHDKTESTSLRGVFCYNVSGGCSTDELVGLISRIRRVQFSYPRPFIEL